MPCFGPRPPRFWRHPAPSGTLCDTLPSERMLHESRAKAFHAGLSSSQELWQNAGFLQAWGTYWDRDRHRAWFGSVAVPSLRLLGFDTVPPFPEYPMSEFSCVTLLIRHFLTCPCSCLLVRHVSLSQLGSSMGVTNRSGFAHALFKITF